MVRRKEWCIKMANIRENKKNGKIISFRFTACLERDAEGKQVRRYTTWEAPAELRAFEHVNYCLAVRK